MTAPRYDDLRPVIYARLNDQLACDVWSPKAPQADDGEALTPFPYVVIPQANEGPWNTAGTRGLNALVQIDVYARSTAVDSAENIASGLVSQVREALEWYALTVPNASWVTTEFESAIPGWEDGGKTRRMVLLFRCILDQA